jgi:dihydroflavonol-4-reductase
MPFSQGPPDGPEVFLTGATGFVGRHVLHALLGTNHRVRALVRTGSRPLPPHPGVTTVQGDLRRSGELVRSMEGCRYLIHVAALYSFSPADRAGILASNVGGTAGILEAARIAGVERAVVTSSSATVGPARDGRLATEEDWAEVEGMSPGYHRSKIEAERAVLAARVPTVLILPTTPVGPGDWKPTPTGKMVVDFMRGRIFAALDGGLNVVPVEDVAQAHVSALSRGRARERYLVGGENLTLTELWACLAEATGRRPPTLRLPYGVAVTLGWGDELRARLAARAGRAPTAQLVPLEGVRMARHRMWIDDSKARDELGYVSSSVAEAVSRAVRWYRDHGYAA